MASRRLLAAGLVLLTVAAGAATAWGQAVEEDGARQPPPSRQSPPDRQSLPDREPPSDRQQPPSAPPSAPPSTPPSTRPSDRVEDDGERRDAAPPARRARPDTTDPSDPVRVADPKQTVVLIFNHGTNRPQYRHNCRRDVDVPQVVAAVARTALWRVHYLCSTAIDGGEAGSYTYKRAREIERVVDAYRAKGVPAHRIFLVGHSAGAWSSLIAARRFGHKFNAVIAFAPAFAGPRYEAKQYPWWRGRIRTAQVNDILGAQRLRALVFAYPDDAFNRPQELAFLRRLDGVRLIAFDRCPERTHGTTYTACFARQAAPEVERYIRARLAAKS